MPSQEFFLNLPPATCHLPLSPKGRCPAGAGPTPLAGDPAQTGTRSITNPQSLNRYAYVLNNPTSLTDPLGLDAGVYSLPVYATTCTGTIPYPYSEMCQNATATMNKMAAAANTPTCLAGEYGCGGSGSTYGEDIFDALAGDSQTKVWVDGNGNIGFTINLNSMGGIPGMTTGTGNTANTNMKTEWGTVGSRDANQSTYTGVFSSASNSGFSLGYPGNPDFKPGGFVCVSCGPFKDGGTSPAPQPKAPSPAPKPPTMGAPAPFSLPGVPLAGWSNVLFPVPSSR